MDSRIRKASYGYSVLLVVTLSLVSCGGSSGPARTTITPNPISNEFVYVTDSFSGAIFGLQLDTTSGALSAIQPFAGNANNSRVTTALGKYLYVANPAANSVSAYAISASNGALTPINSYATTQPGSLVVDALGKFLYVATGSNIGSNISAFTINATTGELVAITGSPFGSGGNFYALATDLSGKFVYVTDNGFLRVYGFAINSVTGALTPVPGTYFSAGSDPLGVAVHPSGKFLYVTDVPGTAGNLLVYSIDVNGALAPITGSPFAVGSEPVGIAIDPSGKFAYVTLNGGPSIAQLSLDAATGAPTTVGTPAPGINPTEIAIDPAGKFVYVTNPNLNNISGYLISSTGTLTPLPMSPYAAGQSPTGIAIVVTK